MTKKVTKKTIIKSKKDKPIVIKEELIRFSPTFLEGSLPKAIKKLEKYQDDYGTLLGHTLELKYDTTYSYYNGRFVVNLLRPETAEEVIQRELKEEAERAKAAATKLKREEAQKTKDKKRLIALETELEKLKDKLFKQ